MEPGQVKEFFVKTVEESLRRLQTDHVDILYSHNVWTLDYLKNPGVLEALLELKKQGGDPGIDVFVECSYNGRLWPGRR